MGPQRAGACGQGWGKDAGGCIAGVGSLSYSPPLQGNNGTFLLSLGGPDAEAFSVSPQRAVGSADVQVLVRVPSLVDYERQPLMLVQVRGALGAGAHRLQGALVRMLLPLSPPSGHGH